MAALWLSRRELCHGAVGDRLNQLQLVEIELGGRVVRPTRPSGTVPGELAHHKRERAEARSLLTVTKRCR
jgi:hypothetical protein